MRSPKFWKIIFLIIAILAFAQILIGFLGPGLLARFLSHSISSAEAATIGIIGGADGPTAIFVTRSSGFSRFIPWICALAGSIGSFLLSKCTK